MASVFGCLSAYVSKGIGPLMPNYLKPGLRDSLPSIILKVAEKW
jgi:hypothetical protein